MATGEHVYEEIKKKGLDMSMQEKSLDGYQILLQMQTPTQEVPLTC